MTAQNLVPNPSFEEIDSCVFSVGTLAQQWSSATTGGTPDIYHTCANTAVLQVPNVLTCENLDPKDGEGYAGVIVYGVFAREYLQAKLEQPLQEGLQYYVAFHVSPTIGCGTWRFTDAIGLAFSDEALDVDLPAGGNSPLTIDPALEISGPVLDVVGEWTKISRCYTAIGDETHIIIGSFVSDNNTNLEAAIPSSVTQNYFFIDQVEIEAFNPLPDTVLLCEDSVTIFGSFRDTTLIWSTGDVGNQITVDTQGYYIARITLDGCLYRDTTFVFDIRNIEEFSFIDTICNGESRRLNPNLPGEYLWSTGSQSSQINVSEPGFYEVTVTNECDTYIFDYSIANENCECNIFIPNTFTPNNDQINDQLEIFVSCNLEFQFNQFAIYDRKGRLVFSTDLIDEYWDGNFENQAVQSGVYVWVIDYDVLGPEGLVNRKEIGDVTVLK